MATSEASTRRVGGRYRLDRSIGSGGMGTVWEGTDELLGRRVAVKEVRFPEGVSEHEAAELKERTLREARATARLTHPNVVTTYDVVEDSGRPYIVMELLDARSLSQVLREDGALPPHRVAELGLNMLSALETSHRQGVVHRDVKPGNVLLMADGRAVLTDFGIATMAGDPALTSTGVVLGSPAYMPPERARGRKPGPEGDLWSLGATLYAAAEGRPPYDSDDPLGTLTAVISDPVPTPGVDGPLRAAILGLLTKDPAERMTIPAARRLLEQAAQRPDSAPTVAVAPGALDRGGRTEAFIPAAAGPLPLRDEAAHLRDRDPGRYQDQRRSRNGLLVAALLLGLMLIGGLVGLAMLGDNNRPSIDVAGTKQSTAEGTPSEAESSTTEESSPSESEKQDSEDSQKPKEESTNQPPEAGAGAGVPDGFERYKDPTGFRVAVPAGWVREQNGTRVDFEDPDSVAFLRIDQTSTPKDDPVADWEAQEPRLAARFPSYERIRIEAVDYRGWNAADWEFTLGPNAHVLNRGFVTDDTHGYALYLSSPEATWSQNQQVFQTAADTFKPDR